MYILKLDLDTVLGYKWLYKINRDWSAIKALKTSAKIDVNKPLKEFKEVLDNQLGEINNCEVKLKQVAVPKVCRFF